MFAEALQGIVGVLVLMSLWFGVQALVRSRKKASSDTDVLDHVKHGCGGCPQTESCSSAQCDQPPACTGQPRAQEDHPVLIAVNGRNHS